MKIALHYNELDDQEITEILEKANHFYRLVDSEIINKNDLEPTFIWQNAANLSLERYKEILNNSIDFYQNNKDELLKPFKKKILFLIGRAYLGIGNIEESYKIFTEIIDQFTEKNKLYWSYLTYIQYGIGRYYEEQNKLNFAKEYYTSAYRLIQARIDDGQVVNLELLNELKTKIDK